MRSRCTEYDPDDYRHSQDVELVICENLGGCWSPYDGTVFPIGDPTSKHIVAKSEATTPVYALADEKDAEALCPTTWTT